MNDNFEQKIEELKKYLSPNERNFHIITSSKNSDELLETIDPQLYSRPHLHFFLFYDLYDASINWCVLIPFLRNWGEVMVNHMVLDTACAITQVKRDSTKEKCENTYLTDFEKLVPFGSDKKAYEARVEEIIRELKGYCRYFVGSFPFGFFSGGSRSLILFLCFSLISCRFISLILPFVSFVHNYWVLKQTLRLIEKLL